ncbi:hypothetical protein DM558_12380 [Entomomonas moraniae]|uniref:DUF1523 family protein n=1 Tax=Entomomonas moraniae TaxID=2213226 RepID=A0A3Q9JN39_9GAMM|nr:hypothetical protein [Entomomonas moraniae]AZS51516.1 hypothetical protein DM558_12380 [Entomomonas moraniae]
MKRKYLDMVLTVLRVFVFKVLFFLFLTFCFLHFLSFYDARYANKDILHSDFRIAIFKKDGTFYPLQLSGLDKLTTGNTSFFSKEASGKKSWFEQGTPFCFSYNILKNDGISQIETKLKTDDRTVWSTYEVINGNIIPIKSKIYSFDYMPMAVILSVFIMLLFNTLKKVIKKFK